VRAIALVFAGLAVAGCSSAGGGASVGGASTAGTGGTTAQGSGGAGGAASGGAGGASTGVGGTGVGGGGASTGAGGSGGSAPIAACKDVGATACFSNDDCPAADRCQNRGTAAAPVPCCVLGPRGAGQVGAPCGGENDCASALCIETDAKSLCTTKCASAKECPATLPKCIPIAFSGSNDTFCTP
jgi:hypothetical protein